jgi:beta-lactam-binding protein with PASTA domain
MKHRFLTSLIAAGVLVAGCGGADSPVPDVVGERLDVAKSVVSDAGYDTEEIGGGMFGILDESNWTVCETRPGAGATASGSVKLIVERTCDTPSPAAPTEPATTVEPEPAVERAAVEPEPAAAPVRQARVTVPSVVGMDHQSAQDRLQAAGLYNLRERDATGQGRFLLWDRNWTVVQQKPAPGRRVGENRVITLFSVKDWKR